jgi:HD-like signal output (HDOD) protein
VGTRYGHRAVAGSSTANWSTSMGLWNWLTKAIAGDDEPPVDAGTSSATAPVATAEGASTPAPGTNTTAASPAADADPAASEVNESPSWWELEDATHTTLMPVSAPDLSTEARALENALVAQFDGHDLELPPLPRVPEAVLKELRKRNYNLRLVADEIAEDQVIAAAVIRMANSPLYGGAQRITTLPSAVNRLGLNALRTLMMNLSMRSVILGVRGTGREMALSIWRRALVSAAVMRGLARLAELESEEAFLIGLLHDIGNVIVLREAQKQQRVLGYSIDTEAFEYLAYQCHQEFGELIADKWNLPDYLRDLITNHHETPALDDPQRSTRLFLQVSDMISTLLGFFPPAAYDLLNAEPVRALHLDDNPDFLALLPELPGQVASIIRSVQ